MKLLKISAQATQQSSWKDAHSLVKVNPHAPTGYDISEDVLRDLNWADAVLLKLTPTNVNDLALFTCAKAIPCVMTMPSEEWAQVLPNMEGETCSGTHFYAQLHGRLMQQNQKNIEFDLCNRLAAWARLSLGVVWHAEPHLSPEQVEEWQRSWRVQQQSARAAQQLAKWWAGAAPPSVANNLARY